MKYVSIVDHWVAVYFFRSYPLDKVLKIANAFLPNGKSARGDLRDEMTEAFPDTAVLLSYMTKPIVRKHKWS